MITTVLKINTYVSDSKIHGKGLFAKEDIPAESIIWRFEHPDYTMPLCESDEKMMHYGYINPSNPDKLVVCGDDARFWNFSPEYNCFEVSYDFSSGGAYIKTISPVKAGEELTINFESDADAARKMGTIISINN